MEKILEDVHAEYHGEIDTIYLMAERTTGEEFMLASFMPKETPTFIDESINIEDSDYEDYYNMALEEAHKQGYKLIGEQWRN